MQNPIRHIANKYLNKQLDLRVRIFNIMAASGMTVSLLPAVSAFTSGDTLSFAEIMEILCAEKVEGG